MSMLHTQIDTEYVNGDDLPWLPYSPYSDEVHLKYFRIDPPRGEIVVAMRIPPGAKLAAHYHTGNVIAHTLRGVWRYVGHDWIAKAGDTVFESAGSSHMPDSIGEEDTEIFFFVLGELLFQDEQGNILSRDNCQTSLARYTSYCREHGLEVKDLTPAP